MTTIRPTSVPTVQRIADDAGFFCGSSFGQKRDSQSRNFSILSVIHFAAFVMAFATRSSSGVFGWTPRMSPPLRSSGNGLFALQTKQQRLIDRGRSRRRGAAQRGDRGVDPSFYAEVARLGFAHLGDERAVGMKASVR